jgi:hypothetical protein
MAFPLFQLLLDENASSLLDICPESSDDAFTHHCNIMDWYGCLVCIEHAIRVCQMNESRLSEYTYLARQVAFLSSFFLGVGGLGWYGV